ncbi:uncharacterized protein [Blastocystis hominis]|uniref:Uncharacterized protein n=1 Tax=Blastocystis hominis TaxID=12968 RepID=D8M8A7_BLAHO|nr:uncharacterized protein [Blastocystis hominis]CBK24296.2 unnamed protein product [Blastocystis hominis]|eukprot:XP_012898344.1 uncharacterized protein [Blastocystis hominis]
MFSEPCPHRPFCRTAICFVVCGSRKLGRRFVTANRRTSTLLFRCRAFILTSSLTCQSSSFVSYFRVWFKQCS